MKRILVIDDEELLRSLLRRILERAGYIVVEARDGNEGVQLFRAEPADLVITDIYMPGKEGLELIRELRAASSSVRIIAMSGGSPKLPGFPTLTVAEMFGADCTIAKPFLAEEVLSLVSRVLAPGEPEVGRQ